MIRAFPPLTVYVPIDEVLAMPRTRLLRMLRRSGWIDGEELYDRLNLPPRREDPARDTYSTALGRLVRQGLVERRGERWDVNSNGSGYQYRLAANVDLTIPPPTLTCATSRTQGDSNQQRLIRLAIERPAT